MGCIPLSGHMKIVQRGEQTMQTEPKHKSNRVQEGRCARIGIDSKGLWLHLNITPEDYIEFAECPELADSVLADLPLPEMSIKEEILFLEQVKDELRSRRNASPVQTEDQHNGVFSDKGSN